MISIVLATLLGLLVGIMRLSTNWLVRNIALCFIELVRNTPQLVQIIFWYVAVLQTLPGPRQSMLLPAGALLNIRGLYLPSFVGNDAASTLWPLAVVLLLAILFVWRVPWLRGLPFASKSLFLLPVSLLVFALGIDHAELPQLRGFNIAGGVQIVPELVALYPRPLHLRCRLHRRDRPRRHPGGAQEPTRGRAGSGATATSGAVEDHPATGIARDGAAGHQPVSQHHQVEFSGRRCRLLKNCTRSLLAQR